MAAQAHESGSLDTVDLGILRALQVAPRAPFRTLADVLGTSEQTVARRYRALRRAGIMRVTAVVSPIALGQSNWLVRVRCRPSGAESLARALAERDDVSWVVLTSGGSEVHCVVRSRTREAREELLVQRLPRTTPVLDLSMAVVLHRFVAHSIADEWAGLATYLDAGQHAALRPWAVEPAPPSGGFALEPADAPLLDQLVTDGRSSYATLAAAAGISEGRAVRRLSTLLEAGVVYLDVDLSGPALGFHTSAVLWLTVTPARLEQVGRTLAAQPEIAFVAAVTGAQNLSATIMCRDLDALYAFMTTTIGPIEGVVSLEVGPVLRTVKQAGSLLAGDRLVDRTT